MKKLLFTLFLVLFIYAYTSQTSPFVFLWNNDAKEQHFTYQFSGTNGNGILKLIDLSNRFNYIVHQTDNLKNGDTVKVTALNAIGKEVMDFEIPVDALPEIIIEHKPTAYTEVFGATRLKAFNNKSTGAEVYISNSILNLGTSSRREANVLWSNQNKIRFFYEANKGLLTIEVLGQQTVSTYYSVGANLDFNAMQIGINQRVPDSKVILNQITINGMRIDGTFSTSLSNDFWTLTGDLKDSSGNFIFEANLVLEGNQSNNELNKLEISFGKVK